MLLGSVGFVATIAAMELSGLRKAGSSKCLLNGALTIANGVGTLLVATGVAFEIGVGILVINGVIQLLQIVSDFVAVGSGEPRQSHFRLNLLLNLLDVIPGVGVLSGIFGLMGQCVFDWAIDWSSTQQGPSYLCRLIFTPRD
ncbi:MAG TPA: hypothetical protein VJK02_01575 [Anaerolineales bacterium]|nr:hypothetical protein [Anaerolineales bacterium]